MERLRIVRHQSGKTQDEVAAYLQVNRTTYTKYETGDRDPDTQTLQSLADYFGVSTDYLLGRTDNQKTESNITDDEGLRIIERARQKMDKRDKERMIRVLKAAFEEEFGNEDDHNS